VVPLPILIPVELPILAAPVSAVIIASFLKLTVDYSKLFPILSA